MIIKKKSGFSFIEVLAVMVIAGILSLVIHSIFVGVWTNFEIELTRIELTHEAERILLALEKDVLEGRQLDLNNQDLVIFFPAARINPNTGQPFFTNFPNPVVTYRINGSNLSRIEGQMGGPANTFVLSRNIDPQTIFILENNPNVTQGGRLLTVQLFLSQDVFHQSVVFEQRKDLVARNAN